MEIKIKHNNELVDASIEMVEGVMGVSPKEVKGNIDLSQFKDGDVIYCSSTSFYYWICILKGEPKYISDNIYMEDYCSLDSRGELTPNESCSDSATFIRHATEEEKKKLFDALAKECKAWDAEKKAIVELKWKPSVGEICFVPYLDFPEFITKQWLWEVNWYSTEYYNKGWCFQTKEECEQFCQKLNQAIEGVKP